MIIDLLSVSCLMVMSPPFSGSHFINLILYFEDWFHLVNLYNFSCNWHELINLRLLKYCTEKKLIKCKIFILNEFFPKTSSIAIIPQHSWKLPSGYPVLYFYFIQAWGCTLTGALYLRHGYICTHIGNCTVNILPVIPLCWHLCIDVDSCVLMLTLVSSCRTAMLSCCQMYHTNIYGIVHGYLLTWEYKLDLYWSYCCQRNIF